MPGAEPPAGEPTIDFAAQLPEGRIRAVCVSIRYRLWVVVVVAMMLMLPALYLALIALVGYATWWHAVENVGWILGPRDMNRGWLFWRLVAYVAPILIGPVVIGFMIKPLFAPRRRPQAELEITAADEPRLFAFIRGLCGLIGATPPAVVEVDVRANAAASWEGGFMGGLRNRLRLTVGLPLVASMPVDRFAGVLVHEFGHFRQGGGMGLMFIVDTINAWFREAVHGRDMWDERLKELADEKFHALGLIAYGAIFLVWCTRKVLALLMRTGQLASLALSRQMEFDADAYEVELAGSDAAIRTTLQLRLIAGAAGRVEESARDFLEHDELPADLPGLIGRYVHAHAPAALEEIEAGLAEEKTGRFDTHPCDRERITVARQAARPGVFRCERPAQQLFADFEGLAARATERYYRERRRIDLSCVRLTDGAALLRHRLATDARKSGYQWFTDDRMFPLLNYDLDLALPAEARADLVATLESRLEIAHRPPEALDRSLREFNLAWSEFENAEKNHSLQLAGESFLARTGSLNKAKDVLSAAALVEQARAELDRAARAAQPLAQAFSEALAAARAIVLAELDDEARATFEERWRLLGKVLAASRVTLDALMDISCIAYLWKVWGEFEVKPEARRAVARKHRERFVQARAALVELFRGEIWPDPLGRKREGVVELLAPDLDPEKDELTSVYEGCRAMAGGRIALEHFLVGDLAARVRRILRKRTASPSA